MKRVHKLELDVWKRGKNEIAENDEDWKIYAAPSNWSWATHLAIALSVSS